MAGEGLSQSYKTHTAQKPNQKSSGYAGHCCKLRLWMQVWDHSRYSYKPRIQRINW